ncbi:hypothetical protein B0A55_03301 [Friedmanniomyces simplex]|uniref:NmrA-like domain-containing protein n=1 Tax=Friedmanniomyces simplex TaxID=329884 RepID=A0A4U0XT15_9PEZI|nr:hypothetical protein B0A55_03301 [Friedmanniomyces simplex]
MSHIVAVAGGTGQLGRAIVEAIKADGKYELKIFGRSANPEKEKAAGVPIIAVDYSSIDSLVEALETHKIDTLFSVVDANAGAESEFNLIQAAEKSKVTKRFVPNIWGSEYREEQAVFFPIAKSKLAALDMLEHTSLEYTAWYVGWFLDFYIAPHVKTYMFPFSAFVDIANDAAAIPGSGDVPVVFTYTFDIAKYAAASLQLPKWEKETYAAGDRLTMNEFLALAQEIKGTQFNVHRDSMEMLSTGKVTELPAYVPLYAMMPKELLQGVISVFGVMFENGQFDFEGKHLINEDFPEVKPRKVRELLVEAWGKK